jgi:LysR family transcriptional regulator, benzoate and cis,cis-muconate-responsive activator of ben and cat genes
MRTGQQIDVPFRTQQFVILAAQAGSFHKAARTLGVDPSVIIRSIDRLESDLGTKIFARTRSLFTVTEPGRLFVTEIQEAVAHVQRGWDLARYRSQIERGPLRFGYSACVPSRLIPILERLETTLSSTSRGGLEMMSEIRPTFAKQEERVVFQSGTTAQVIGGVMSGELHAGFGVQPMPQIELWTEPIIREPFCLCVSKNHRLAKQTSVMVKELDGEKVYFLPRAIHPGLYDRTIEYMESTGIRPTLREVVSLAHVMEIVTHNFGVAILAHSASRLSHTGVLFKPISDKLFWMETALFHRHDLRDARLQKFLHELRLKVKSAALDR